MTARVEAVGFDHGCCLGETMRDSSRLAGVASESDGHPAFLVPPASDLGVEGSVGVDFKRPAAVGKHMQRVTGRSGSRAISLAQEHSSIISSA